MQRAWGHADRITSLNAAFGTPGKAGRFCRGESARREYCGFKQTLTPSTQPRNIDQVYWQQTIYEGAESSAGCAGPLSKVDDNMDMGHGSRRAIHMADMLLARNPMEYRKDRIEGSLIDSAFPRRGEQKKGGDVRKRLVKRGKDVGEGDNKDLRPQPPEKAKTRVTG